MLGSIIGDIIGSTYEFINADRYDFDPFPPGSDFTDDTVLTIAIADAILSSRNYAVTVKEYASNYPGRGYGGWFNETCQKTVPEALICFLESKDFEDAIRKAIWLGGDNDTMACITGGISGAFYNVMPDEWEKNACRCLDDILTDIVVRFQKALK